MSLPKGIIDLAFCPTGEGGGVDPHCSPANKGQHRSFAIEQIDGIDVWVNPTAKQVVKYAKATELKSGPIRVLITLEGDLYAWPAFLRIHTEIMRALKVDRRKNFATRTFNSSSLEDEIQKWMDMSRESMRKSRELQLAELPRGVYLAFCPTGEGGGVDPHCAPGNKGKGEPKSKSKSLVSGAMWEGPDRFALAAYANEGYRAINAFLRSGIKDLDKFHKSLEENSAEHKTKYKALQKEIRLARKNGASEKELQALEHQRYKLANSDDYTYLVEELQAFEKDHGITPKDTIATLDRLISKAPKDKELVVYRAMRGDLVKSIKAGDIFQDDAFVSTSSASNKLELFGGHIWTIKVPKGSPRLEMNTDENEVLLPRGTKLKILKSEAWGHAWRISAEVVPSKSIELAFCPTGEGGGVDPHCEPDNKGKGKPKPKLSADDLDALDDKYAKAYFKALKAANEFALRGIAVYVRSGSDEHKMINGKLRGIPRETLIKRHSSITRSVFKAIPEKTVDDAIKGLEEAFKTAPKLQENLTVYRGITGDIVGKLKKGQTFTDKGYMSTSLTQRAGSFFAFETGALLEISVPKGTKAILPSKYFGRPGEREVLLDKGQSLRVKSIETVRKGKSAQTLIKADLV